MKRALRRTADRRRQDHRPAAPENPRSSRLQRSTASTRRSSNGRGRAEGKNDATRSHSPGAGRKRPPYVPWSMGFTKEAKQKLQRHFGCDDLESPLENHLLRLGSDMGFFDELGNDRVRDVFGVVWDRSVDKDIGNVEGPRAAHGRAWPATSSPIRWTRASSPTSPPRSPASPTGSASSRSVSRSTSGPGPCGAWKT